MTLPDPGGVNDPAVQQALDELRMVFPLRGEHIADDAITAAHIAAGAVGDSEIADSYIVAGTYTPTLTNVTNIAASTARALQYMRVGNVVTVSGYVTIDPTVAGYVELGISLPIASDFSALEHCGGTARTGQANATGFAIWADAANNRAELGGNAVSTASQDPALHFTYQIL